MALMSIALISMIWWVLSTETVHSVMRRRLFENDSDTIAQEHEQISNLLKQVKTRLGVKDEQIAGLNKAMAGKDVAIQTLTKKNNDLSEEITDQNAVIALFNAQKARDRQQTAEELKKLRILVQ